MCDKPEAISEAYESYKAYYIKQAQNVSLQKLVDAIEHLSSIESDMRWSTQPRVLFEIALIKICRDDNEESLSSVIARIRDIEDKLAGLNLSGNAEVAAIVEKSVSQAITHIHATQPVLTAQTGVKKASPSNEEAKSLSLQSGIKTIEPLTEWPLILKTIKTQRQSMYSLLSDSKIEFGNKNELFLVFPPGREFNAEMVAKEENRKYLEELLVKSFGRSIVLKIKIQEMLRPSSLSVADNPLVKKAYELFGKENVEIVED